MNQKHCTVLVLSVAGTSIFGCMSPNAQTKFRVTIPVNFHGEALIVDDPDVKFKPGVTYDLNVRSGKVLVPRGFLVRKGPGNLPVPEYSVIEVRDNSGKLLSYGDLAKPGEMTAGILKRGGGDELAKTGFDVNCYLNIYKLP